MKKCPHCGAELNDSAVECDQCHFKFEQNSPVQDQQNTDNTEDAEVHQSTPIQQSTNIKGKVIQHKKLLCIIAVAVIAAIVLIVVAVSVSNNITKKNYADCKMKLHVYQIK